MEYISSDTNVWIDFMAIDKVELPFLLPCTYIMSDDAVNDELLSPEGFKDALLQNGLKPVEYTEEEFTLADSYGSRYPKLSIYDRLALSIAKVRGIILLTGDRPLRRAAATEGVRVVGSIGLLDRLRDESYISNDQYLECLQLWQQQNGGHIRLPQTALEERIKQTKQLCNLL